MEREGPSREQRERGGKGEEKREREEEGGSSASFFIRLEVCVRVEKADKGDLQQRKCEKEKTVRTHCQKFLPFDVRFEETYYTEGGDYQGIFANG